MKLKALKILTITLCLIFPLEFPGASITLTTSLLQTPIERSFPWLNNRFSACPYLTFIHSIQNQLKPVAHELLPVEYSLHESIPIEDRPFFYVAANAWNMRSEKEMVRISSEIDRGAIDIESITNDKKNVIYLINEEHFHAVSMKHGQSKVEDTQVFMPGITINRTERDASLPFVPIVDSDIMIRAESLTDLEYYRKLLIMNLQRIGVEGSFSGINVSDLRMMLFSKYESIGVEDFRSIMIRGMEGIRDVANNENVSRNVDVQEIDQRIEYFQNMQHEEIRFHKYGSLARILNVDMEAMQTRSSITLLNSIMHEMGHGLGLNHYPFPIDRNQVRPLMKIPLYDSYSDLTTPLEIDISAVRGAYCLYSQYLDPSILNN